MPDPDDNRFWKWRTLVRVETVDLDHGQVHVIVPPWSARETVPIELGSLPAEIRELVAVDKRFHARVNTGADRVEDLVFSDWETS